MTIAQQLKITKFPFIIKDDRGNEIYYENSNGLWDRYERDSNGNVVYREHFCGFWVKYERDSKGNVIYWEDSSGSIKDNRPKSEIQKAIELLTEKGLLVDGKVLKN